MIEVPEGYTSLDYSSCRNRNSARRNSARAASTSTTPSSNQDQPAKYRTRTQALEQDRVQLLESDMQIGSIHACLRAELVALSKDPEFVEACFGKGTESSEAYSRAVDKRSKSIVETTKVQVLQLVLSASKDPMQEIAKVCL